MTTRRNLSQQVSQSMDIYQAISCSIRNIELTLSLLRGKKQQGEKEQRSLRDQLKAQLKNLYTNIKIGINEESLLQDPTGILENNFILTNNATVVTKYPHHILLQPLIQSIIDEDTTMPRAKKQANNTAAQSTAPASKPQEFSVENLQPEPIQEEEQVQEQPVVNEPAPKEASKPKAANKPTPKPNQVKSLPFNAEFHKEHMDKIEGLLKDSLLIDEDNKEEVRDMKKLLNNAVKVWVDSFYKNVLDFSLEENITEDTAGLHTNTTIFSDPDIRAEYPMARLVTQRIASMLEAYKEESTKLEVNVWTVADAIFKAHDSSEEVFELSFKGKDAKGKEVTETIIVNKTTNEVNVRKEGKTTCFGRIFKGVKRFFRNILDRLVQFKDWIVSWFKKDKGEPKVVSQEEADKMEEAIAAKNAKSLLTA